MVNKKSTFSSWTFLWAIIDTFVNILVLVAVVILLAERINGWLLAFIIFIFILWVFRPMYLTFKKFFEELPKKKPKKQILKNVAFFMYFLLYLFIFFFSVLIFIFSVNFLGKLIHPLVLSFSFIVSAVAIILYHHFTKREFKGPFWSFSKFFFIATLFLFISVIFFSSYGLKKGINAELQEVNFDVYIVNEALLMEEAIDALNYSKNVWANYNISINYGSINKKKINLSDEEIEFLFNNGSSQEECLSYDKLINKITDESNKLSVIFLDNNKNKHAGRGCLCNCSFTLVSPEKLWFFDFTGWNVAHEIGHVFGLSDIQFYGRIRENLMNDETKKLLFFNSDFLDQYQVNIVINKTKSLNQETHLIN